MSKILLATAALLAATTGAFAQGGGVGAGGGGFGIPIWQPPSVHAAPPYAEEYGDRGRRHVTRAYGSLTRHHHRRHAPE
jgi:hypothetical protein